MNEPLEVGEYNGKLQYQCYKEDGIQLNGAVVTFNLICKGVTRWKKYME